MTIRCDHINGRYGGPRYNVIKFYFPLMKLRAGTSTSTMLDGGGCLDVYTDQALLAKDQECCHDGPATKILSTVRLEPSIEALVKPNHPIYGGDTPGILPDPYFGVLE